MEYSHGPAYMGLPLKIIYMRPITSMSIRYKRTIIYVRVRFHTETHVIVRDHWTKAFRGVSSLRFNGVLLQRNGYGSDIEECLVFSKGS